MGVGRLVAEGAHALPYMDVDTEHVICPMCGGLGWLCELYVDRPWENESCGCGGRCECNPGGEVRWRTIYANNDGTEPETRLH